MAVKITACLFLMLWLPVSHAVIPGIAEPNQTVRGVTSGDIMAWVFGLVIVLSVFFLCVWGIRKLGGLSVDGRSEQIRIIGGLSLGMREKVVLLQVGKQQLVLGVTPGRIEALLVLEGDNCLKRGETPLGNAGSGFAKKLAQTFKANNDA